MVKDDELEDKPHDDVQDEAHIEEGLDSCCCHPKSSCSESFKQDLGEASLQEETVKKLQLEAQEFKDKYFRNLAELENTRKRLQKDKIESQSFALQSVILDLLAPLDNMENALKYVESASVEIKNWAMGFQMILEQLKQALSNHGVSSFEAVGQSFDPHLHEAVETLETDEQSEGTVIKQYSRGYKLGGRVIRPARVVVATAKQNTQENLSPNNVNEEQN